VGVNLVYGEVFPCCTKIKPLYQIKPLYKIKPLLYQIKPLLYQMDLFPNEQNFDLDKNFITA
jgi:hypothetical protein